MIKRHRRYIFEFGEQFLNSSNYDKEYENEVSRVS